MFVAAGVLGIVAGILLLPALAAGYWEAPAYSLAAGTLAAAGAMLCALFGSLIAGTQKE